eukprot:CAMPEP_0114973702 /NCGR_PEP_ID=MMETSP0216-20121206/1109_1 /TAXON_ID=223996 /ORGANISM="Protocruzia adherens, Strain Boccale" /LENGTH=468 /DNA_ID=CAMNT_0002334239 /DNA_START=1873 /DNA_END=3279 /DNA_ORIENTATION=+
MRSTLHGSSITSPGILDGAIKSLELDSYIKTEVIERLMLSKEGNQYLNDGTPEAQITVLVPAEGIKREELMKTAGNLGKVGFAQAMKKGWIALDKASGMVNKKVEAVEDTDQELLRKVSEGEEVAKADIDALKKRKWIDKHTLKTFRVLKGDNYRVERVKPCTDLTFEMLEKGDWTEKNFKPINLDAKGKETEGGHLHPLLKMRTQMTNILLEMGFEEMPTNKYVENSFWNFDALFQPQQHPARDAQDTFFVTDPATTTDFPEDYLKRVQEVHEKGGHGSFGYGYDWKIEEAQKNVMRTHTTAVTARMLYKLAQDGFKPTKFFSIDRVFRNETLDRTHLAEFHQIEGVVADYNVGLSHLIGLFTQFFEKIGITNLKFKPAYNPYTEPSMEIFGYHPILKKWVEIGNSGVFRPEMLRPMGLPEGVQVLGWGLSLERPTMIQHNIGNIRSLFGPDVSAKGTQENAISCFK